MIQTDILLMKNRPQNSDGEISRYIGEVLLLVLCSMYYSLKGIVDFVKYFLFQIRLDWIQLLSSKCYRVFEGD
jgi:hypothetical protein